MICTEREFSKYRTTLLSKKKYVKKEIPEIIIRSLNMFPNFANLPSLNEDKNIENERITKIENKIYPITEYKDKILFILKV